MTIFDHFLMIFDLVEVLVKDVDDDDDDDDVDDNDDVNDVDDDDHDDVHDDVGEGDDDDLATQRGPRRRRRDPASPTTRSDPGPRRPLGDPPRRPPSPSKFSPKSHLF